MSISCEWLPKRCLKENLAKPHILSTGFVRAPLSGSTKFLLWFSVFWLYLQLKFRMPLQDFHFPDIIIDPGTVLFSTPEQKTCFHFLPIPPNTHCCFGTLPMLYLCLANKDSSLFMERPVPPMTFGFARSFAAQTSLK